MNGKSRWLLYAIANILIVSMIFLGAGCSESTSPDDDGGGGDTTPPELSSVTPTDVTHIEVTFSEAVEELSAEHQHNYDVHRYGVIIQAEPDAAMGRLDWGDTLHVESAVLQSGGESVILSVNPMMINGGTYHLIADNIEDLNGNAMTGPDTLNFVGTGEDDTTPPEIIDRTPLPGATGVGIGQAVTVTFSEPMEYGSVASAFSWKAPGDVDVSYDMHAMEPHIYTFSPEYALDNSTTYTVAFAASTAQDYAGNYLAATSWSYTTTDVIDTTPPTVVSTTPADGATNVSVNTDLQIEFSETIDPNSLGEGSIMMTPDPGEGIVTWIDGGTTLSFEPNDPLLDNTVYTLIIAEGAVRDLAGNPLSGNYQVVFTTGSSLPTGGYSGTVAGDPNSTAASNPEGALSIAFMVNMMVWEDEGGPPIGGFDEVASNGSYSIENLEDGTYWPAAMMDTDGNGEINPDYGDAIGMYGVDFGSLMGEPEPDSLIIAGGGTHTDIDFGLYDPIAIWGRVEYGGTLYTGDLDTYNYYVGLFDTTTYDPENLNPEYGTEGDNIVYHDEFRVHEFNDGLVDGTYYIGAYLDVNYNDDFDPATDPAGFYAVGEDLIPVTVENGEDSGDDIVVIIYDPEAFASSYPRIESWTKVNVADGKINPKLRALMDNLRRALEERRR
jgi:hypothetical protein